MKLFTLNLACYRVLARNLLGALLACPLIFAGSSVAEARLNGSVAYTYSDFRATEDHEKDTEIEQFTQRYSLYMAKEGILMGGRAGRYSIGLGYEWLSSQFEVNGDDSKVSTGKLLYHGSLSIAPGALPFRLDAYSQDLQVSQLSGYVVPNNILEPRFDPGLSSGERRFSGVSLMVGIRNGTYLGQYREILSKYPRVFVDYKDVFVRDDTGIDKQHYQQRDLAFVSLNKKDNWFHYRYKEYKDYRNPENNYNRKAYILGTIDHRLKRAWINLSNWIKISTDLSLTVEHDERLTEAQQDTDTYDLNLFSLMAYDKVRVSNFNRFYRSNDSVTLDEFRELPVYANGQLSPDMSWRGAFINYDRETVSLSTTSSVGDSLDKGTYASGQLLMGQRAKHSFNAKLDVENRRMRNTEGSALRLRLEAFKNNTAQSTHDYFISYSATYQNGHDKQGDVSYIEQLLQGRYEQQLAARHRMILTQVLLFGSGESGSNLTAFIPVEGTSALRFSDEDLKDSIRGGRVFRFTSKAQLESTLSTRLSNTVSGSLEWVDSEASQLWQGALDQTLRYINKAVNFTTKNYFLAGDNLSSRNVFTPDNVRALGNNTGTEKDVDSEKDMDYILGNNSILQYQPNKQFKSRLEFDFNWVSSENDAAFSTNFSMRHEYAFYSKSGNIRQFGAIYNETEYELVKNDYGHRNYLRVLLGGVYRPYRILEFGSEFEYADYGSDDLTMYRVRTRVALNFAKLQCEARYAYGRGQNGEQLFIGDRKEHLVEVEVKKQF